MVDACENTYKCVYNFTRLNKKKHVYFYKKKHSRIFNYCQKLGSAP